MFRIRKKSQRWSLVLRIIHSILNEAQNLGKC
nr:MAG TPA: hypothetical protein [Caudoviricetes sp.]